MKEQFYEYFVCYTTDHSEHTVKYESLENAILDIREWLAKGGTRNVSVRKEIS